MISHCWNHWGSWEVLVNQLGKLVYCFQSVLLISMVKIMADWVASPQNKINLFVFRLQNVSLILKQALNLLDSCDVGNVASYFSIFSCCIPRWCGHTPLFLAANFVVALFIRSFKIVQIDMPIGYLNDVIAIRDLIIFTLYLLVQPVNVVIF